MQSPTPILVRGKRKSPSHPPPPTKQQQQQQQQQQPTTVVPDPIMTTKTTTTTTTTTTMGPPPSKMRKPLLSVLAARRPRPRQRRLSPLECLPAELLESILLYSSNVSLPRASPVLGVKLSQRATLLRLFIWSFHDTWHQWFGIPAKQALHHVPQTQDEESIPCQGDAHLQSAVLQLPWVDIDFILQAQQTWADRYARDRWYQHSSPWHHDDETINAHHAGGFAHFNARACFELDFQQAVKSSLPFRQWPEWRTQDVHPLARMPTSLITGPWNDEQLRRLFWLTRGGIMMDHKDRPVPPWEVKLQCLENAVVCAPEPNALVANCLMGCWIYVYLPREVVARQLATLERRIEWGADSIESKKILRWAWDLLFLCMQLPDCHLLV
ncbi:hypothetical protein L249_8271 [Ophiocordyceps polyrhachis-furcata BCC 54312]|uniref:F-box domain-containing protein n=1 Tax=Ophiocordyceps polyrhachis-furcata BCC 54312 TaxID=1330021 RepID=A0A367LI62_9HYPO|nr:hypothetical protein L249_8271 [Ophiocordyceps polyrhachis-furcata BCC 54312]